MKEIKDDINRWRIIPCFWVKRINILKMTVQCNLQSQCDPCQITNGIFHRPRTKISQFVWKHKWPWIVKAVLRKKNGAGGINLPDFTLYYKAIVIKTVRCWHKQKYRPMEQDRKPGNKLMCLWVPNFWQRRQEYTMRQRETLQ